MGIIFGMLPSGGWCHWGLWSCCLWCWLCFPQYTNLPFCTMFLIRRKIHIDHVLNFGTSSLPGIFGRVADAAVRIFLSWVVEAVIKWVDKFIFFHYPAGLKWGATYNYHYSTTLIWKITEELGWPWAPTKFVNFPTVFMYIGFQWDLSWKEVTLLTQKKTKYLEKLLIWTQGSHHTSKEMESLIGTLNHVCLVVLDGQSHLVSLYKFCRGFMPTSHTETRHRLSTTLIEDIVWWMTCLHNNFVSLKIIRPPAALATKIYIDVSTSWKISLILDGKWLAWEFCEGWKPDGHDIGWGEMVAIELAVCTLLASCQDPKNH